MQEVILATDAFDPSTWERFEVEDVREFLMSRYPVFPDTARIYHNEVNTMSDVTPSDEASINRLAELDGVIFVVIYPGNPLWILVAVVAVIAVAAIMFLRPDIPNAASKNNQSQSPNNQLAERTNRPRLGGRIADIYGQVTSTPDLLAVPYTIFRDHREIEISYMCIGRGAYEIGTIYDDTTPVSGIEEMQVEVYGPNTSPLSGHAAQVTIGDPITEQLATIEKVSSVNGQTLYAPNFKTMSGHNVRAENSVRLRTQDTSFMKWPDFFDAGDVVTITNGTVGAINLDGTYTVESVTNDHLTLVNPGAVNSAWNTLGSGGVTGYWQPIVALDIEPTVGPFFVDIPPGGSLIVNLAAPNGLYKTDGQKQSPFDIFVVFEMTPVDAAGVAIGPVRTQDGLVRGSNSTRATRASTTYLDPGFSGRAKIEARRTTLADYDYDGQIADELKWRDLYVSAPIGLSDFGNVTTVMAVTFATDGALAVKDRKLNMLVTRKIPEYAVAEYALMTASGTANSMVLALGQPEVPDYTAGDLLGFVATGTPNPLFGLTIETPANVGDPRGLYNQEGTALLAGGLWDAGDIVLIRYNAASGAFFFQGLWTSTFKVFQGLVATKRADAIICAMCLDPYIGNRKLAELDVEGIYATIAAVEDYFGTEEAAEFSYTYDKENLSFEETLSIAATAVFSMAYRRGRVIKLSFEKATSDSTLLFNHRNKLPGSETRTVRFGYKDDIDGVEYTYVDPEDDAVVTKYLPEDQSAINPKKVESLGVRSHKQAHFHIHRIWNKIRYQNTTTEFTGLQQAEMLLRYDRILVADNTRSDTLDGEVLAQNVLELTLSQPVEVVGALDHTIFLQHTDGTVQAIELVSIAAPAADGTTKVVLAEPPTLPLPFGLRASCGYVIVSNDAPRSSAFLVSEREPQGNFTSIVTAINYDARYYQNDLDFITVTTVDSTLGTADDNIRTVDKG